VSDNEESKHNRFAEAVAEIAHSQMGYLIGFGIMMLAIGFSSKWDGHLYDRKDCVELKEISGKIFKVDSCSGDVEEVKVDENEGSKK